MTPIFGFVLVGILLLALYVARRAAKNRGDRGRRPRRVRISPASIRMSARTEMRAMDDSFTVMGPTTRPEASRAQTREKSTGRSRATTAARDR